MLTLLPASLLYLLIGLNYTLHGVNAAKVPFQVRTTNPFASSVSKRSLFRRAPTNPNAIIPVSNTHNAEYISNITLGGRQIPILLDTGRYREVALSLMLLAEILHSSDLWVTGSVPTAKDVGKKVSLNYAVGNAHGTSQCEVVEGD